MFFWNSDRIRFLRDASEYLGFYDSIAEHIAERLPKRARVCDAGCGLGYLSLALAKRTARVTAVDVSEDALSVLREGVERQGAGNIDIICADIGDYTPKDRFDAMVFCFFGGVAEAVEQASRLCSGRSFLIKKDWQIHRFASGGRVSHSLSDSLKELEKLNLPFECEIFELEMGQPLKSMEDARAFFSLYRTEENLLSDELILERLTLTGDKEYPFFLSSKGRLGMITLDTSGL